jgi:hypothetical protein
MNFWIDGIDMGSEGSFYWSSNGKQVGSVADFAANQPDNFGGREHCLMINKLKTWNDLACDIKLRYICELE